MSEKIVLIDGHSILNRAFFGVPDLTNSEGLHTNAVYGFLNILFKILDEEKPDYLTVAFDVHAPTFRHKMYEEYKGTRKPMAEELRQQVPVIKEVLHSMGIKTIEQAGLEADDLLGTLSVRCEKAGLEVVIVSGDRDLLQLATKKVKIRIPKTKQGRTEVEDYTEVEIKEKYQVTPTEFIDMKALMGDTADNIPGVPGIGEKTAAKIITSYHSIENAYEHVDELKPPRASKMLKEHWDSAVMSKTLATIEVHADFAYELDEAKLGNLFTEEAYVFFQRLEFKNLLSKFDIETPVNDIEDGFETVTSKKKAWEILENAAKADCVGATVFKDTANVLPLFAMTAGAGGIGISYDDDRSYCIHAGGEIQIDELLEKLNSVAMSCKTFSMFDIKSKMEWVKIEDETNCFDATVAAYLLNPLKNDYGYEDVAKEQFNIFIDEKCEADIKVCYEACTARKCVPVFETQLKEAGMWDLFKDIEMPLVFTQIGRASCRERV